MYLRFPNFLKTFLEDLSFFRTSFSSFLFFFFFFFDNRTRIRAPNRTARQSKKRTKIMSRIIRIIILEEISLRPMRGQNSYKSRHSGRFVRIVISPLFGKIARVRKPETQCIRKRGHARARMRGARVLMHTGSRSHRFFSFSFSFLFPNPASARRRISEFHRRPRLPELRSIPKPKDEAAKPQIAQDPRHLI